MTYYNNDSTILWSFKTRRFSVSLIVTPEYGYQYDGDDEDGDTQAALDRGDLTAFNSCVLVYLDGTEIGADYLGGSVYADWTDFATGHRTSAPDYRNTLANKARGVCIGYYFPDMVAEAIQRARDFMRDLPKLRNTEGSK